MNSTTNSPETTTVLVTGGSGHLGGHVILRLLDQGYRVRTTVRSPEREQSLRAMLAQAGAGAAAESTGHLDVRIADLSSDAGWPEAVRGVDSVLHVASPFPAAQPENDDEVIAPAHDGALRVVRAARDEGVRRVVMTSSFAAVGYSAAQRDTYTEADWTDPTDENTAYIRSKVIAERAAWDFVAAEGRGLELTVINPTGIFGPVLDDHLSSSIGLVAAMIDGAMPTVPPFHFGVVDVRDVADLHIRAMTAPDAAGERFLATSDDTSSLFGIAEILRGHLGEAGAALPRVELSDDEVRQAAATDSSLAEMARRAGLDPAISNTKAKTVLGWQPRSAAHTIVDTADGLIARRLV